MTMKKLTLSFLAVMMSAATATAQDSGTLAKIAERGEIVVGHRDGSVPFSYYDDQQKPIGYAMDLCAQVVEAVKTKLGKPDIKVSYMPVTGTTRIPLLANGTIDMECGTTTNNADRQKQVTFSTTNFVAGVRILSKKNAPIASMADAKGRTVVTLAGTTSVKVINAANTADGLGLTILSAKDLAEGMLTLETDRAVALIFDDVSIAGAAATSKAPADYQMSTDPLSVEPYGIMLRRNDDAFKSLVNATLEGLYKSGEINAIYDKWFTQPIPPRGINMNFPMSAQLKNVIANPTDDPNPDLYR
ncbi:transporter substrate-binding domain-containing protein [Neorhizobium sp. JUb45]|uniref:transporter substrate-binding domain-containing protein n=1 Tax=unclassified Neorhizobium TaxID=2629175 RepID=UPI001A9F7F7F|nr:transporter substrate-binding domain-containing protein [Neorhizobium sp. JUb45]